MGRWKAFLSLQDELLSLGERKVRDKRKEQPPAYVKKPRDFLPALPHKVPVEKPRSCAGWYEQLVQMSRTGGQWEAGDQGHACAAKPLVPNEPQESVAL